MPSVLALPDNLLYIALLALVTLWVARFLCALVSPA